MYKTLALLFAFPVFCAAGQGTLKPFKEGTLWGFRSITWSIVIPAKFQGAGDFSEGLAPVAIDGKWGFINTEGELVIPAKYDDSGYFWEGNANVSYHGLRGRINRRGEMLVQQRLVDVSRSTMSKDGIFPFLYGNKVGYALLSGLKAVKPVFEDGGAFSEGFAPVKKDGKWGFINKYGVIVIKPVYDMAFSFNDGLASVLKNGKWGFVDGKGFLVITNQFDDVKRFSEGLAPVKLNLKWGYVDKTGKIIIPVRFDDVSVFLNDVALGLSSLKETVLHPNAVFPQKKIWMNKKGEWLLRSDGVVYNGVEVVVSSSNKYGLYSSAGVIVAPRYEQIQLPVSGNLFSFQENGKYGYMDNAGNIIIPATFDYAQIFFYGVARILKDGKYGLINSSGTIILPAEYDQLALISQEKIIATRDGIEWDFNQFTGQVAPHQASVPAAPVKEVTLEEPSQPVTCKDVLSDEEHYNYAEIIKLCGISGLEAAAERGNCFICRMALAEHYAEWGTINFNYDKSVQNAGKAVAIKPADPRPYETRAALSLRYETESYFEYFKQAIIDYLKLVELDPGSIARKREVCKAGGKSPDLLGRELAVPVLKYCDDVVKEDPADTDTIVNRAAIHAADGNNAAAIADLDKVLNLDSNNTNVFIAKAHIYESLRDWEQAAANFTRYIDSCSDPAFNPEVVESRGLCYLKMSSCKKAKADFDLSTKSFNIIDKAHHRAAYYWVCEKDLAKTLWYIEELLKMGGECEGECYRPEEYKDLFSGLEENKEYKGLVEKYRNRY